MYIHKNKCSKKVCEFIDNLFLHVHLRLLMSLCILKQFMFFCIWNVWNEIRIYLINFIFLNTNTINSPHFTSPKNTSTHTQLNRGIHRTKM